jgi:tRNA-2-methylthio-N6-dimethylallyladenosine synthase
MSGYKEITLLGQNVNSYKSDISFAMLLKRIAQIEGDFILRFMTSHPKDVSDELIDVIAEFNPKIAPCFHLPLQSGSDKILKAMNRTYSTEKYLQTVKKLREKIPDIAITSDIIVGFPGETEEDFQATMNMLSEVRFDMVYSFIYSPREGTRAAKMDNRTSDEENKNRMSRLLEYQCDLSHKINDAYVGTVQRVLVDSFKDSDGERIYNARNIYNKLVHFNADNVDIGSFVNVKISRAGAFDLFGELI